MTSIRQSLELSKMKELETAHPYMQVKVPNKLVIKPENITFKITSIKQAQTKTPI